MLSLFPWTALSSLLSLRMSERETHPKWGGFSSRGCIRASFSLHVFYEPKKYSFVKQFPNIYLEHTKASSNSMKWTQDCCSLCIFFPESGVEKQNKIHCFESMPQNKPSFQAQNKQDALSICVGAKESAQTLAVWTWYQELLAAHTEAVGSTEEVTVVTH